MGGWHSIGVAHNVNREKESFFFFWGQEGKEGRKEAKKGMVR